MPPAAIPLNEAERVADLHSYELLDTLDERGYDDITFLAQYICETPVSLVTLVDTHRQWFKSAIGAGDLRETSRADSFCSHLIGGSSVLVVQDTLEDDRFSDNPLVTGELGIRFYAGAPLITPDGHVIGTVCVIDQKPRSMRTEQVRALEALARQVMARMELRRQMRENTLTADAMRTAEKLAAVGRMASSLAHEINNPLQSVTNLLYMVEVTEDKAERRIYLKQAEDALARVSHLVTQSLRFHKQSRQAEPVRLAELAESILMLFQTRLSHASAQVVMTDRQTAPLVCLADDIRQVLTNLVSNSLDALSGRGKGKLYVRVRDGVSAGRKGVFFSVADTGQGIAPDAMARLFQPFNTTKGIRGTGLGLWVTKGILQKHGARVRVRSRVQVGTVVRIFFPAKPSSPVGNAEAKESAALPVN
ncbi:sensor histidine kinase [Terriglobus roseus]|uniref:histidine kinase n=1 Tax=Terriglobus roseus TaxID=392734 RepID=A0A1H4RIY0_9BACT|nr:ATP-binding protein [Terriglobus roseus]SEC31714.1 His Kinase A (phospho-acceptor) domain-containing protein [Terriglobus roseus]